MRYLCAIVATTLLAGSAFAATINVPGDYTLIQDAINASSDGDVIAIEAGTYYEANLNPGGKAITIQGTFNGDGTLATTIDAQQGGSVFVFNSGPTNGTEIKDLVITGGSANTGGGIVVRNSSNPTISGCTISGNTAQYEGGGIYSWVSSPTITNCTISGNSASFGGGIWCNDSSPTISGCTIEGNAAQYEGGGIRLRGDCSAYIEHSIITGNTAETGGGIGISAAGSVSLLLSYCTISGNMAIKAGGGISNEGDLGLGATNVCENTPDQIQGPWTDYGDCWVWETCPPEDTGGCCLDQACTIETSDICSTIGGEYLGDGSDCFNTFCDGPLTGACCTNDTCVVSEEADCNMFGGQWMGSGTACNDEECPQTCPGDVNDDGTVNVIDLLTIINYWGTCP